MGRRAIMAKVAAGVVSYSLVATSGASVVAAADSNPQEGTSKSESKQEADERKQKEQEARRLAEETKQRLAAGRIGRI